MYKLFHTLAVIMLAVTVSDDVEPADILPVNTESFTLMPRIINPFAIRLSETITLPGVDNVLPENTQALLAVPSVPVSILTSAKRKLRSLVISLKSTCEPP